MWEESEWRFRVGDAGRDLVRASLGKEEPDSRALLRDVIVPACRADFLQAAAPYRLRSAEIEQQTGFSLISALLGLLDEDLRTQPFRVTRSGVPSYAVAALAVELVMLNEERLNGRARPSLDQARRLHEPAERYLIAENVTTIAAAEAGHVTAEVDRKGNVCICLGPAHTPWGDYDHSLFLSLAGGDYDEPEVLDFFHSFASGSRLSATLNECSEEMRAAFGFGVEALLFLVTLAATISRRHANQNFIVLSRKDLLESFSQPASDLEPVELEKALQLLVMDVATLRTTTKEAPLTLPTGPSARLVTRPLVRFGENRLATTPELIKMGSIQLLRHLLDGRLPNGEPPRPGSDLARSLDRLRGDRTGRFEELVRRDLEAAGFVVSEIPRGGPIAAQIDAVAADCVAGHIWVVSVKDPLFPFRPKQAMEHVTRFFTRDLQQLQGNMREVHENRDYVWRMLRSKPNGSKLPLSDPSWAIEPVLIYREPPPAIAVRNDLLPARLVLRRHLADWAPGGPPPPPLNPAVFG